MNRLPAGTARSSAGTTTATTTTAASTRACTASARSASSCAYALLFVDPAVAALLGWCVAMTSAPGRATSSSSRKGYDHVNQATHEYKEEIKVGYNMRRKVVLMAPWALSPLLLWLEPTLFGLIEPATTSQATCTTSASLWLALGVGGPAVPHACSCSSCSDVQTGLVWMTKILTDPFHDIMLYHKAPLHLLRGELIDPMAHVRRHELDQRCAASPPACRAGSPCWSAPASRHHQPSACICARGGDEALARPHRSPRRRSQAEDQAAGADPAQRQALRRAGSTAASSCSATGAV